MSMVRTGRSGAAGAAPGFAWPGARLDRFDSGAWWGRAQRREVMSFKPKSSGMRTALGTNLHGVRAPWRRSLFGAAAPAVEYQLLGPARHAADGEETALSSRRSRRWARERTRRAGDRRCPGERRPSPGRGSDWACGRRRCDGRGRRCGQAARCPCAHSPDCPIHGDGSARLGSGGCSAARRTTY